MTFLLDVTDDREWNREQLLAFFVKQKDFESITALGLYDLVKSLKEYRCFPLFFHVDTNKYPELSLALYQCLNPEKSIEKGYFMQNDFKICNIPSSLLTYY